jgi:hypothetical protein
MSSCRRSKRRDGRHYIGWSCHDLFDKPIKGCNAILDFTAAEDSGVVHVECSNIGPGAATEVLVLDTLGSMRPAVLRGMLATAGLNARLFIGRDDEFILFQGTALPLASV